MLGSQRRCTSQIPVASYGASKLNAVENNASKGRYGHIGSWLARIKGAAHLKL